MKVISALAVKHFKKKKNKLDRIFTINDKNPLYFPIISTLQFFEVESDQSNSISHEPFDISQTSRVMDLIWKKCQVFPNPLLFFIYF